ncbi:MAG: hypothetical protein HZA89_14730 [Verrucomicrobia bacterium]|nr:hypothetical protein [Verrucomicrobiota bacterium]
MSELQSIESVLTQTARRQRWQRAWLALWKGMLVAGGVWLLALALYKLLPLPLPALAAAGVAGLVILPVAFWLGWRKEFSPQQTARWLDGQRHLKERLSTALEFSKDASHAEWEKLIVRDAAAHAAALNLRELLPIRLPRTSRWALLLLAVCAGLGFVPEHRSAAFRQRERDREIVRRTGEQLTDFARRTLEHPPALETAHKALDAVNELGEQFTKQTLTRADAVKELSNAIEKLQQQAKQLDKDPMFKRLPQAARAPGAENAGDGSAMQKQIQAMQDALGKAASNPDAVAKLKDDLAKQFDKAKSALEDSKLSEEEKRNLASALSALAQQADALGLQLPALEQAMAALADLGKMSELAKNLQQLQEQAAQLGKDLAEQLQRGQVEAAASTLEKMAKQLETPNLSEEQLKKIAAEVSKAMSAANQYGDVSDHFKNAMQKLQSSQNLGASKDLATAAAELREMSQYLTDARTLKAATDALLRAQLAMCSGQGLGQLGMPRAGQGGKPGRGVGTWADEQDDWLLPPTRGERWDNTGIERPDTKPRDPTDRGDGQLPDDLQATKIRGQFSPGASMPSITLKGLSVSGQSSVAYEEAVTAAQTEAQSALNQEKVPRAYQGAVKDYFNDLKK